MFGYWIPDWFYTRVPSALFWFGLTLLGITISGSNGSLALASLALLTDSFWVEIKRAQGQGRSISLMNMVRAENRL